MRDNARGIITKEAKRPLSGILKQVQKEFQLVSNNKTSRTIAFVGCFSRICFQRLQSFGAEVKR